MWSHLKVCSATASSCSTQLNLKQTFTRNILLQKDSVKAKAITRAIGTTVAVDLRPYSIVENEGFIQLLRVLEPRYSIISRKELTKTVVPEIYSELKAKVKQSLSLSECRVKFTMDMWKCEGQNREYMTVTAHWAIEDPEKKSFERKNALLEVEDTYNIRKSVRK